jgi:hypothetical protein
MQHSQGKIRMRKRRNYCEKLLLSKIGHGRPGRNKPGVLCFGEVEADSVVAKSV